MKFVYTGIEVSDLELAIAFYRDVLGMTLLGRYRIPETGGEIAELRSDGGTQLLELNWYPEGSFKGTPGLDHLAFEVHDADQAFADLMGKGFQGALTPFDEGGSRLAYVKDPDGNWIQLSSPRD